MLRVKNLYKHFRGLVAVNDLSFEIQEGELIGLIGPNGAGKTTVFNLISGVFKPDRGQIRFLDHNIVGKKTSAIAALGLTRTFQSNILFENQTCFENILMSCYLKHNSSVMDMALGIRGKRSKTIDKNVQKRAEEIVKVMGLEQERDHVAEGLPQGVKRILGVANALATDPKLLLLDEPVTGMSNRDIDKFKVIIKRLIDSGVSILLVEHNLRLVMDVCQRIVVINFGAKIAEGDPQEIKKDQEVIEAYLGG